MGPAAESTSGDDAGEGTTTAASLDQVMAEIDEEVRRRRASGDLPARVERELDALFLEHSPVAGRGGNLVEALRLVDASAFIDPVVPVASQKSGGAALKKGLRTAVLWYMGYVTHQISQFTSATSRALHLLDDSVVDLQRQVDAQRVPPALVVDLPAAHRPEAWWVVAATKALVGAPGRVLHAAAGDGWLVRLLAEQGIYAYGVDPRAGRLDETAQAGSDLREEDLVDHLLAVEPAALGGVVLTGVAETLSPGERDQLLELLTDRLSPDGTLVLHSLTPAAWVADDGPVEADLAAGHPLRPRAWVQVLTGRGYDVVVHEGSGPTAGSSAASRRSAAAAASDYLVVAVRRTGPSRPR